MPNYSRKQVSNLSWNFKKKFFFKISCDYIIVGDFNNGKEKKGILLTSRVHPGESMVSYVIEYIIEYLAGN